MAENKTGTSSKTITILSNGEFYTSEPPPLCPCCNEEMHPMVWLCGRCGEVA